MHLTLTLATPTRKDSLEALIPEIERRHAELVTRHHARPLVGKANEVSSALLETVRGSTLRPGWSARTGPEATR